jgi:hypothetical protein
MASAGATLDAVQSADSLPTLSCMDRRMTLVAVSAGQLTTGLVGLWFGVRRRLPADPIAVRLNLSAEHLARDQMLLGTARSAPGAMLLAQAVAITTLARRPSLAATRTLGYLGASMIGGYLIERRNPLLPRHFELSSTGLFVGGLMGAVAMAWLALRHAVSLSPRSVPRPAASRQ